MLFERDGELWVASLSGEPAPRRFVYVRQGAASPRWSPDGRLVAFVSRRHVHGFIGVYDEANGEVRWIGPGVDRDQYPRWPSDSRRLAFMRNFAGAAWGLFVGHAETGEAHEVWRAPEPEWRFRNVDGLSLEWVAGDRLVFPVELGNWQRLTAVPAAGGVATPLTHGDCEVEAATVSPDRRPIVVSSNCHDIERRQLYALDPAGGEPRRLTIGSIDWGMAITIDCTIVFHRGYGRAQRAAPRTGARGASEYQDVLAGAEYLRAMSDVDPARVGLWGGSYGGYLTMLALGRSPDVFAAGVDLHGVHDWNMRQEWPPWSREQRPPVARDSAWRVTHQASPVAHIANVRGPVLIVTGDDDRNVNFLQAVDLVERLRRANKEYELLILPDEVHSFLLHRNWLRVFGASADFLDRTLAARAAADAQDGR